MSDEPPNGGALRLGLLVDALAQPAWVVRALRALADAGVGRVVLVVVVDGATGAAGARTADSAASRREWLRHRRRALGRLPYALYDRFDRARYGPTCDVPPLGRPEPAVSALFGTADVLHTRAHCTGVHYTGAHPTGAANPPRHELCDADVAAIEGRHLDLLLRFGPPTLGGRVLAAARHGVWWLGHGDDRATRGGPPGFWEVALGERVTGATLRRLTDAPGGGPVLARAVSATNAGSVSANNAIFEWHAGELLVGGLRRLQSADRESAGRAAHAAGPAVPGTGAAEVGPYRSYHAEDWHAYDRPLRATPGPLEMTRLWARIAARVVRRKLATFVAREQWFIAYHLAPAGADETGVPERAMHRYRELRPPDDRYWADPFPVDDGERRWVFYEEHPFGSPHAHINVVEIDGNGAPVEHATVLRRDYHVSYPSVFRWRGEWWMTPETMAVRKVQLFRATRFPYEWEHAADLLEDVAAADPTLVEVDGRWWMFVAGGVPGAVEPVALRLYTAETPLGPWRPHPHNPLTIDARGGRPAGRVFRSNGRLYRPGQDGTPAYGSAVVIYRIDVLTDEDYRETPVARIDPAWRPGLVGTHTLNASGRLSTIDVRERRRAIFGRFY